jgi:transposase InsO family protein
MRITTIKSANTLQPIFKGKCDWIFKPKPIKLKTKFERWRNIAKLIGLSNEGLLRLEWIIFYYTVGKENTAFTTRHFNISRQCFYKWSNRFNSSNQNVKYLETLSKAPHNTRTWTVTLTEQTRIKALRNMYMHWGKKKLKKCYQRTYNTNISTWKIESVIRRFKLYPDHRKQVKIAVKRLKSRLKPKRRIQELSKENSLWFLLQLDGIVIYWNGLKRYIFTAVDHAGKLAFARMYNTKSSNNAADFLYRLRHFINEPINNLQTDNGSEFALNFEKAVKKLGIKQYFSRVRTPKDNSEIERFNQTLQYEWLNDGHFTPDCKQFNKSLTKWLIEYNFVRPHESLDYLTPIEYIVNTKKVSTMYPART